MKQEEERKEKEEKENDVKLTKQKTRRMAVSSSFKSDGFALDDSQE